MKKSSLQLCQASTVLCFFLCAASLGSTVNFWVVLVFANLFCITGLASLLLSLWVYWCCPPDLPEGTGLSPSRSH